MTINKTFKKKWVKALRSGDYEQATGVLYNGTGFCCLGVACDIGITGDWINKTPTWALMPDNAAGLPEDWDSGSLPGWFRDKIGLSLNQEETLIELNDNKNATFVMIADHIEKNL